MSIQVPDEHKMTREQAGPWLVALRSGEYEQAAGTLCTIRTNDLNLEIGRSYCCLGIRALVEGATFKQGLGEVDAFVPGFGDRINDSEMLVDVWAKPHGLTYETQLLLSRLNDGYTACIKADHELVEVYRAIAVRSTAVETVTDMHSVPAVTCEFEEHDFPMIANVIEKYFIR